MNKRCRNSLVGAIAVVCGYILFLVPAAITDMDGHAIVGTFGVMLVVVGSLFWYGMRSQQKEEYPMGLAALHISRQTWQELDMPVTDDDIKQKLLLGADWGVHTISIPPDDDSPITVIFKHKDIPDDGGMYELHLYLNWHVQNEQMFYDALEKVEVRRRTEDGWKVCATIT